MHLLILGLFLVVGILVYYIMTTSPSKGNTSDTKKNKIKSHKEQEESHVPNDLRKEDNVIFLPSMNKDAAAAEKGQAPVGDSTTDEDNR